MASDNEMSFWMAWGSYLEHLSPLDGKPCEGCIAGPTPSEGCEEGQQLWSKYKDARTQHRIGAAK